jgi:hypothetical protein
MSLKMNKTGIFLPPPPHILANVTFIHKFENPNYNSSVGGELWFGFFIMCNMSFSSNCRPFVGWVNYEPTFGQVGELFTHNTNSPGRQLIFIYNSI